jgi:hypothetical protein
MAKRSYDYFEHEADIGIIGRGPTLAEAFESAATAMFAIMAEPARIKNTLSIQYEFEEDDPEFALVTLLNRSVFAIQGETKWRTMECGSLWRTLERTDGPWHRGKRCNVDHAFSKTGEIGLGSPLYCGRITDGDSGT